MSTTITTINTWSCAQLHLKRTIQLLPSILSRFHLFSTAPSSPLTLPTPLSLLSPLHLPFPPPPPPPPPPPQEHHPRPPMQAPPQGYPMQPQPPGLAQPPPRQPPPHPPMPGFSPGLIPRAPPTGYPSPVRSHVRSLDRVVGCLGGRPAGLGLSVHVCMLVHVYGWALFSSR